MARMFFPQPYKYLSLWHCTLVKKLCPSAAPYYTAPHLPRLQGSRPKGINPQQAQEVQKMEVLVALPSAQCQRGAGSSVVLFSTPNGLFQFRAKKNTSCFQYVLSKHSKSPLPELLQQTCWTQHQETCDAVFRLPSHICLVSTAATLSG